MTLQDIVDYNEWRDVYIGFMHNPANRGNCGECPVCQGPDKGLGAGMPCGHHDCWVDVYCKGE